MRKRKKARKNDKKMKIKKAEKTESHEKKKKTQSTSGKKLEGSTGRINTKINDEKEIEKVLTKINKKEKKKKDLLRYYLKSANIDTEPERLKKKIFNWALITTIIISIILSVKIIRSVSIKDVLIINAILLTLGFILILFSFWLGFYFYIDMLKFNRTQKIESVLVDFLQLTSANIRAGMPIDQALWFAIRPRFGILAKEIEIVEKKTLTGEPLEQALMEFSDKYDSQLLKNSISLLIEGMKAGGEIGSLLNNIADNIKDSQILKKEMAANVMTYVIFITFSTLMAAPFLMGLSYELLKVITHIGSQVSMNQMPQGVSGMTIGFGKQSIKPSDFKNFGMLVIGMTSGISAMIVTMIQKGNLKSGLKTIILFIIVGILLFLASIRLLDGMFASIL